MKLPEVDCTYGAPMGRPTYALATAPQPALSSLRLFKVELDSGGYDNGGAYWGLGDPLYCLKGEHVQEFTRAMSRDDAAARLDVHPSLLARPLARTRQFQDQHGRTLQVRLIKPTELLGAKAIARCTCVEFARPDFTHPAYALSTLLERGGMHGLALSDHDQLDYATLERVLDWVKSL